MNDEDWNNYVIGNNPLNIIYDGTNLNSTQYYSFDLSNNSSKIKTSYFPMIQSELEETNSRIKLTSINKYNNETITSWQWIINGTNISGILDQTKYYYTSANLDLNVCVILNSTYSNCQSILTWDNITPLIDANIDFTSGFTNDFNINYNMICYDNFSPINYKIEFYDSNLTNYEVYNSSDANATLVSGIQDIGFSQGYFKFTCSDASSNYTVYNSPKVYALNFNLINEATGEVFDLNKVTKAVVYTYDGEYISNLKDENNTTENFLSPTNILRFDFTYPDESTTELSREIDFDYIDDTNIGVCLAEYQQFYLYRFLSTTTKPIVLYNDFANCYNLASTTRFLFETYQSNTAYTINKPYYAYTYIDGEKTLLALLDGASNSEINLDVLAFNQIDYAYSTTTDGLGISFEENANTVRFRFFSNTGHDSVNINIYKEDISIWSYTETVDTNSFVINFFYGDLNVDQNDLLNVIVTMIDDDVTTSFEKYFTTAAEVYQGIMNQYVAIILSALIMIFGISMVAYKYAMGWFGLIIAFISIAVLSLAPQNETTLFLMGIYFIIGMFIGVVAKQQNLGVA
jgi:hypothetical protein